MPREIRDVSAPYVRCPAGNGSLGSEWVGGLAHTRLRVPALEEVEEMTGLGGGGA